MPVYNKNINIPRIFNQDKRLIQRILSNNSVVQNSSDIMLLFNGSTSDTGGNLVMTLNSAQDYIITYNNIGANVNIFKKVTSVNSISKSFVANSENNGAAVSYTDGRQYYFFSNVDAIESMVISQTSSAISFASLSIPTFMPNLKIINFNIIQIANMLFLNSVPQLRVYGIRVRSANGISSLSALRNSNLYSFSVSNFSSVNTEIFSFLPPSLYHFSCNNQTSLVQDLKDYFNGIRVSLTFLSYNTLTYSGGAIFPSVLNDTADYRVTDYIVYLKANSTANSFTGNALSQFIIDFANQVTAVNLNNSAKRMRFVNGSPNTSFTDPSKPLYQTYTSALAHITSMNIAVTFT